MRIGLIICSFAGLLAVMAPANSALAGSASEAAFYANVAGKWSGGGEIVAGKFKGTKFNCLFQGTPKGSASGIDIDGSCRVGVFSQPMTASFKRSGGSYSGKFLDGAAGEGMDIVGGSYSRSKLVANIRRKDLNGVMVARHTDDDKLNITISVRVNRRLIPVIGMLLDRRDGIDNVVTSSVK
ncbi:MAG: hypothetical protein LJE67_14410 [Salaquimonas sp.]|jgi:hypothetical protein|nr:hypothetical protein [Salaquimonas sp.]